MPSFFTSTAGLVTGTGAVIGAGTALYGASKVVPAVYQAVKNRWINKVPEIDRTIDIPMDATPAAPVSVQATTELAKPAAPAQPDRLQRAAEIIEANRQAGLGGQPMTPVAPVEAAPMGPVAPTAPMAPEAPQPIATPLSAAPVDAPAPTPTAGPNSAVTSTVVDEIKSLIAEPNQPVAPPQDLMTGTGKPAFAGQGPEAKLRTKGKQAGEPMLRNSYAKVEDVPVGYAFVPGAQNIDSSRSMIGQSEYTNAYTNRPFPSSYESSVLEANEINRMLGRPTRAEAKAAGIALPPQTPGITKSVLESQSSPSMGTKAAKVGGILGALVAIPDLAKAENAGQRGMAGANLLEAVLPPGFAMSGAGEGSDQPPRQRDPRMANINMTNASMFAPTTNDLFVGNPYAQSELAKKLRQDQEYIRKIGGGRGIAPPSAYMR